MQLGKLKENCFASAASVLQRTFACIGETFSYSYE